MRHWLAGSVGLGVALSAVHAVAQSPVLPPTTGRPAVRIVSVRPLEDPSASLARSQVGGTPMPPANPMGTVAPPASGGVTPPRPFTPGPGVTEARNGTIPPPTLGGTAPVAVAPAPPPGYAYQPPAAAGPAEACLLPTPNIDAPLYGGCAPAPAPVAGLAAAPYPDRWWMSAEYLLWWTKSAQFPALVTTSSPAFNGILGTGDTRVLIGNGSLGQTLHGGGRFGLGYWFGCEQRWGVDGSVFFLGSNGTEYRVDSSTTPVIARPFTNLNQNVPFSQLIASPGLAIGSAAVDYRDSLWGADVNLRRRLAGTACSRLDLLGGFRFVRLSEDLRVTEAFARTPDSPPSIGVPDAMAGTVFDHFGTENQFYGGQLGLQGEVRRGRWYANMTGKVALGTMFQTVTIDGGQSILMSNGTVATAGGGLLAVPGANIGTWTQNKFAVVPEVGLQVGYHLTPYCRMFVGYNFLYLSSVLRPGNQIDTGLDVTRIPNFPVPGATPLPTPRPQVPLRDSDFFAQGVSFGLQFKW